MAPPVKEEEEHKRRRRIRATTPPRDELAEMMVGLAIGERKAAAAVSQFREQEVAAGAAIARFRREEAAAAGASMARFREEEAAAAAAAVGPFFPGFLGHRNMDPYAIAPAQLPPVGAVREAGPSLPLYPPPVQVPPRDRGMLDARRFPVGHARRGEVLGPRINEQCAGMLPPRAASAARGVIPGDYSYMPPPLPQPFLHGGAAAVNPQAIDPDLFLPEHEQAVLLALSQQTPEKIVSYSCDLMQRRHGQRLFRLVLRHCNHELREWVVATITRDKKSFWSICAQRSDEVVFLIKSCETRRSMQLLRDAMVSWMEPNLMQVLMADSNRLRVVQAFILSSPPDIAQIIFEAVAKNCTRLACQPNGLNMLQKCLEHISRKEKDNIFTKISYMSFHLAQNSSGNYIVQDVLKKGDPSHFAIIASCLRNHYVRLSKQKYSSRVVEWCLRVFDEGEQFVIINELICYPHFRDLVTDEFANFVLSTALRTCNFSLKRMLANAILAQNINQRNQHCAKIFDILANMGIYNEKF
ncbi:putative pumilio homolog 8, chloroplastic [Phragmites australis]|uniref:putative pumilio homolog 8, chloroplastic n=1 Tax=Phragmites australis TaxID=29695 RepID=UPI002D77FC28|nr:putative pumilio homolog 8, chloroplastic [Phragmites australis]